MGAGSPSFLLLSLVQRGDTGAEKALTPGSSQLMQRLGELARHQGWNKLHPSGKPAAYLQEGWDSLSCVLTVFLTQYFFEPILEASNLQVDLYLDLCQQSNPALLKYDPRKPTEVSSRN